MDIRTFLSPLCVEQDRMSALAIQLSKIYRHLALNSTEQFLPTPVNMLPRGTETGRYLAIDIGGSNLRVGFMELLGANSGKSERIRSSYEKSWPIQDHFKMDNAEQLFSWIGSCIALVVREYINDHPERESPGESIDEVIPMGITFSFPMVQASISEAKLMPMGKGFAITSDMNLGEMLLDGYAKHAEDPNAFRNSSDRGKSHLKLPDIKVAAITNDTVATLASLAYSATGSSSSKVAMGLIVGTGTNSAVLMRLEDLHETKRSSIELSKQTEGDNTMIVVNTEWTIKGAAPPLRKLELITKWDKELDSQCEAPGFQPFEYMTSGRYLGEIARLILRDHLINVQQVAPENLPKEINQRNAIPTLFLSDHVAKAVSPEELLPTLRESFPPPASGDWDWTRESADLFITAAHRLRHRSARMHAAAVVGLLASAGELMWKDNILDINPADAKERLDEVIVAYAGGVISSYPGFLKTCQENIDKLINELTDTSKVRRVVLRDANKGGIIGAGILAGTVWNLPGP